MLIKMDCANSGGGGNVTLKHEISAFSIPYDTWTTLTDGGNPVSTSGVVTLSGVHSAFLQVYENLSGVADNVCNTSGYANQFLVDFSGSEIKVKQVFNNASTNFAIKVYGF